MNRIQIQYLLKFYKKGTYKTVQNPTKITYGA